MTRALLVVRGDEAQTREQAVALSAELPAAAIAWISTAAPRELAGRLGQAFDLVIVDAHQGLDADVLGQAHGLVFGGGTLLLLLAEHTPADPRLAAFPYTPADVGRRFATHVERVLERHASPLPQTIAPAERPREGTDEQAQVVAQLLARWTSDTPTRTVLIADRGRGKSSALGLALRELSGDRGDRIITAASETAAGEVLRFAGEGARFVPLLELLGESDLEANVIVIDEAAQLPVPMLQRLVLAHPRAHLAWATTTHGYEGTGRGFSLRFLAWLERQCTVERLELRQPIRWSADDPLERAVFEALLLDAEPAVLEEDIDLSRATLEILDRDQLIRDLPRLRELFGLLVHAHYRTTPGDLHRLLDAPNLQIHAALLDGHVVGACVVAEEGELPEAMIEAARAGRGRLRAHALADVLVAHLGHAHAGRLRMRRSVRVVVHPSIRRRKLASRLVEHVHASHDDVDLFGTLFGATPELIEFRRALGYEVVRISASRGARTGEPSVMMLRPASEPAQRLLAELRRALAREFDLQLQLLQADDGLSLEPALITALRAGLPTVEPYSPAECLALARDYAHGPRTFESVAVAVRGFLATTELDRLPTQLRAVVEGRALRGHGWRRVTRDAGLASVTMTMRALRRAIRSLVDSTPLS